MAEGEQAEQEAQDGGVFLGQCAEPLGRALVVLLPRLHHAQPGLGHGLPRLLAKHLAQVSSRRLHLTCSRGQEATGPSVTTLDLNADLLYGHLKSNLFSVMY